MDKPVGNYPEICDSPKDACKRFIDKIIKTNREIFIMLSILDQQMCGYDIIKYIFLKFNVLLCQGTVYPILYRLENDGLIYAEYSKGDMRAKKYSLTPQGREIAEKDKNDFIEALEKISAFMGR